MSNAIRIVELHLKQHIRSHILIMEQRVLITYEGQPITCYGYNETGHQYGDCPHRRTTPLSPQQTTHANSWAKILINGPRTKQQDEEKRERREEKGAPLDAHKTDTKKHQKKNKNRKDRYRNKQQQKRPPKKLTITELLRRQKYPQKQQA